MDRVEELLEDPSVIFVFPTPEKLRPPLIRVEDASFGYSSEDILLKSLNFHVDSDSRIVILGSNGVGKSTFLKLLTGEMSVRNGSVYRNPRIKVSMFT